jgi:hypothetical protein
MANLNYEPNLTGLIIVDPYNDASLSRTRSIFFCPMTAIKLPTMTDNAYWLHAAHDQNPK